LLVVEALEIDGVEHGGMCMVTSRAPVGLLMRFADNGVVLGIAVAGDEAKNLIGSWTSREGFDFLVGEAGRLENRRAGQLCCCAK